MQGKLCRQKNKIFIGGTIEMQYVIPFRLLLGLPIPKWLIY